MAYPKFGDYEAVVTDNSEFYKRGYIRVRVSAFFNGKIDLNLSQSYNDAEFKSALKDDIKCLVSMPFGGGNGHGMFSLPQVNSVGYVSFLNGDINKALWKGSYVNPKYDANGKFYNANVPNDRLIYEGAGSEGITVNGKQIDTDGGAMIIRQKSTKSGSAENMNWDNNRTENLIVLDEKKLIITHASKWKETNNNVAPKEYQEISIIKDTDEASDTYGKTTISLKNIIIADNGSMDETGIEIIDKKVSLKTFSAESKIENNIDVDENEISLNSLDTNTKRSSIVTVSPDEILLNNKDSNILVSKDEINISSKKLLTLSSDEVRLGGLAQEYVVTASIPFSYRMEDGTVLGATHRVKA